MSYELEEIHSMIDDLEGRVGETQAEVEELQEAAERKENQDKADRGQLHCITNDFMSLQESYCRMECDVYEMKKEMKKLENKVGLVLQENKELRKRVGGIGLSFSEIQHGMDKENVVNMNKLNGKKRKVEDPSCSS